MLNLPVTIGNGCEVRIAYLGVSGHQLEAQTYPFDLRPQALLYVGDMTALYTQSTLTYQSAEVTDPDRWEYLLDCHHPNGVAISVNGRLVTRIVITLHELAPLISVGFSARAKAC